MVMLNEKSVFLSAWIRAIRNCYSGIRNRPVG